MNLVKQQMNMVLLTYLQLRFLKMDKNRIKGGLYGLLVGDALGVPYEFHHSSQIPEFDLIEPEPPAGFSRAHSGVKPATWSDDGAQALCLLDSLLEFLQAGLYVSKFLFLGLTYSVGPGGAVLLISLILGLELLIHGLVGFLSLCACSVGHLPGLVHFRHELNEFREIHVCEFKILSFCSEASCCHCCDKKQFLHIHQFNYLLNKSSIRTADL